MLAAVEGVEQAALAPDHVGQRAVDHQQPERSRRAACAELHALGIRAADQGRRDDREHELVDHPGGVRDGGGVLGTARCRRRAGTRSASRR